MPAPRVVVLGSSNTDLVVTCPRLPRPGESVAGGEFARHAGGKGANQAVAAARAGAKVSFIGAYGDDEFGRVARRGLRDEGIDVRHFTKRPGCSSGIALIVMGGATRENLIAVAESANQAVSAEDVAAAERVIASADAALAQLEVPLPAVVAFAEICARYGVPFILNPAPSQKLPRALLRNVHTLTPNETEAVFLTGEADPVAAARRLRLLGCSRVALTLGACGALLVDESGEVKIPAPRVCPMDTVGAGDCFAGWLAVGLATGLSLVDAAKGAVSAAAISVTRPGAQASMPYRREVCRS